MDQGPQAPSASKMSRPPTLRLTWSSTSDPPPGAEAWLPGVSLLSCKHSQGAPLSASFVQEPQGGVWAASSSDHLPLQAWMMTPVKHIPKPSLWNRRAFLWLDFLFCPGCPEVQHCTRGQPHGRCACFPTQPCHLRLTLLFRLPSVSLDMHVLLANLRPPSCAQSCMQSSHIHSPALVVSRWAASSRGSGAWGSRSGRQEG